MKSVTILYKMPISVKYFKAYHLDSTYALTPANCCQGMLTQPNESSFPFWMTIQFPFLDDKHRLNFDLPFMIF